MNNENRNDLPPQGSSGPVAGPVTPVAEPVTPATAPVVGKAAQWYHICLAGVVGGLLAWFIAATFPTYFDKKTVGVVFLEVFKFTLGGAVAAMAAVYVMLTQTLKTLLGRSALLRCAECPGLRCSVQVQPWSMSIRQTAAWPRITINSRFKIKAWQRTPPRRR